MNTHTNIRTRINPLAVSAAALALVAAVQIGVKLGAGSPEPTALAEMASGVG